MMRALSALPLAMSLVLPLALSALCLPAAAAPHVAEWTRVGRSANPEVYLDLRSIKDENGGRSASVLRNYPKAQTSPDGKPYRSVQAQHLYACKDHTATMQAQAFYPDTMGKGEAVGNFKYEQYDAEKIPPGTAMDSVLKRVCRKARRGRR